MHALGDHVVLLAPADHPAQRDHREADQAAEDHRVGPQLHDQRQQQRQADHPYLAAAELGVGVVEVLTGHRDFLIGALAPVAEGGDGQAGDHAQRRQQHGLRRQVAGDAEVLRGAGLVDVGDQDVVEEDRAEAHRQRHVQGGDGEGDGAGDQPAIQLEAVHHVQQRRHQDRDEGDVHRDQRLGQAAGDDQCAEHAPLDQRQLAAGVMAVADVLDHPRRQALGDAGARQRHGEGAEGGVGQRHRGAAAETVVEGRDDLVHRQAGGQAADHRGDDQGEDHGNAQHRQRDHDHHRENNCIHVSFHQLDCFYCLWKRHAKSRPRPAGGSGELLARWPGA
ncbi:hypothetical protein D3C80_1140340 [compost metagenome]